MQRTEQDNIRQRYQKRDSYQNRMYSYREALFKYYLTCERERIYFKKISEHFRDKISNIKFLEIGAGYGYNLYFFARSGIPWSNIWANELLDNRLEILEKSFPSIGIIPGDALEIKEKPKYDLILISTVLTSVLDQDLRNSISEKAYSLLDNGGMIIIYDFIYNNPENQDVRKISRKEIKYLFRKGSHIEFRSATLAPPIGRVIGNKYNIVNYLCPFLRSHIIAIIYK